jgi:hypothetical protein
MEIFIIIACVVSAVLGTLAITTGYTSTASAARVVTDVWLVGLLILNKAYLREYWTNLNKPIKEYVASTPAPTGTAKLMQFGLAVLIMIRIGLFFA